MLGLEKDNENKGWYFYTSEKAIKKEDLNNLINEINIKKL